MANIQFPQVPQQAISYTSDGRPVQQNIVTNQNLGAANFSNLIGNNITVPVSELPIPASETSQKRRGRPKKNENGELVVSIPNKVEESEPVNSREIVENTIYSDTYATTTKMAMGIIGQTDELLSDCKQELDMIRAQRNLKGRYHYINSTVESMSSLLSTKLAAIREINGTIKNINDNEYRRYKDMRAIDNTDDNKAIMDAYSAFISAPVGAPEYKMPGTPDITGGLNGVIRSDYPSNVQAQMDAGMAHYLSRLSPEENLMLQDSNQNIEEVIVYDQATGTKEFKWMDTSTGDFINNMPPSSNLILEDFTIDPRTKLAKNTNLNMIKKVVVLNEGAFSKF